MSYTTLPTKQVKRTDFLGRIGWLLGVERWKYQDAIIVSGTWTKEEHNALITVPLQCRQSEMRHHWWVAYCWENVTTTGDEEPVYVRSIPRPIEEAQKASDDFHTSWQYRLAVQGDV